MFQSHDHVFVFPQLPDIWSSGFEQRVSKAMVYVFWSQCYKYCQFTPLTRTHTHIHFADNAGSAQVMLTFPEGATTLPLMHSTSAYRYQQNTYNLNKLLPQCIHSWSPPPSTLYIGKLKLCLNNQTTHPPPQTGRYQANAEMTPYLYRVIRNCMTFITRL